MTWFPCLLQAYIWFNQFWMLCGQCCCCCCDCDNKSCKCLAVPIAVKKNSKEILNDGKKKKKNQRNQGYGVDERKEDSEDRFNLAAVYGFDDDNWVVHRGYGPNMQLSTFSCFSFLFLVFFVFSMNVLKIVLFLCFWYFFYPNTTTMICLSVLLTIKAIYSRTN